MATKVHKGPKDYFITVLIVVAVSVVEALALNAFYTAYNFPSTGIVGFAQLINYVTDISPTLLIIALNLPILLYAFFKDDKRFVSLSIIATIVLAAMLELFKDFRLPAVDPILAALFGGAIVGAAGSFVVKRGGSMGGMDTLTIMLSKRFSFSKAYIDIAINMVLIAFLLFIKGLESCMLLIVAMMASSRAFDAMMAGFNRTKTVLIISAKNDEIAPLIMERLKKGVTFLYGKGAFTNQDRKVIYCIVRTMQLKTVKDIVKGVDEDAIFSIIDTKEVTGRGFAVL